MGNVAKTLTCYLKAAEDMSKDEFITTYAYSDLIEKSGIVSLEHVSLFSVTKILNDTRDVLNPITDSSELISNKAKVFELRTRSGSLVTDIFVGRSPANDIVLINPSVSKSHLKFISIPQTKHYQMVKMFSSNGTYLNGKKINPFEKHQVEDLGVAPIGFIPLCRWGPSFSWHWVCVSEFVRWAGCSLHDRYFLPSLPP